jgi:DNA (cytosine-5)-methyltransferase 1
MLVLSLFPGIGLLDMAFEEQGFCVVRGPDQLWGGDVHTFHPPAGRFDGVIGGPPCQQFGPFANLNRALGNTIASDLIPEFERCVAEARPAWFLMENVPAAPEPQVDGYAVASLLFNNRWAGGEQKRVRRFAFGVCGSEAVDLRPHLNVEALEHPAWSPAVLASGVMGPNTRKRMNKKAGPSWSTVKDGLRLQGLPDEFFKHAPFTAEGAQKVLGNGVPLPMGRAIAGAVCAALLDERATAARRAS